MKAIRAEPEPSRKLAIYARAVREIQVRMAPLHLALRDASATEPEARRVWEEISDRRAANMRKLAQDLRAAGELRSDLSIEDAGDVIWAMNSSELYVLLTTERGWSPDRYESWLAESWCRLLLRRPVGEQPAGRTGMLIRAVGLAGIEPATSSLSGMRSNRLSYSPSGRPGYSGRRIMPGWTRSGRHRGPP